MGRENHHSKTPPPKSELITDFSFLVMEGRMEILFCMKYMVTNYLYISLKRRTIINQVNNQEMKLGNNFLVYSLFKGYIISAFYTE